MTPVHPADVLLRDPLSKETRAERRSLLGASAIGIVIVKTGLVPSKISALGIDFNQTDQRSLLLAIASVIGYFLLAFLIYAGSDFLLWRLTFRRAVKDFIANRREAEAARRAPDLEDFIATRAESDDYEKIAVLRMQYLSTPMSVLRSLFEFALPVIISIYAIVSLIRARV